jgi:hypothetical protein
MELVAAISDDHFLPVHLRLKANAALVNHICIN